MAGKNRRGDPALKGEREPVFTVIAGINGAGKTSLYHILKSEDELGERVNIDEIVKTLGSWKDPDAQVKAGMIALERVNQNIADRVSFHLESTLPGLTVVRQIKKAKANGFRIRLYFIGVDDLETAIARVHKRMSMGGHGVADEFIRKRFERLLPNLRQIIPYTDLAIFYDNSVRLRQIALFAGNMMIDCDRDLPNWFIDLIDDLPTS